MTPCDPATTMREFALAKTAELLNVTVDALKAAAANPHADAVHDMRVSIRRLQQGLRLFKQYLPGKALKHIRKNLRQVMDHAGTLRNYDVGIDLLRSTGGDASAFEAARADARQALSAVLEDLAANGLVDGWAKDLKLERA